MSGSHSTPTLEAESSLVSEQLQALCGNQIVSIPINMILALSIAFTVREEVSASILTYWLLIIFFTNLFRFYLARRGSTAFDSLKNAHVMLHLNGVLTTAAGLIWALVPLLMLNFNGPHAPHILLILAGISAGASFQAGTYAFAAIGFAFPIFASLIFKVIVKGEQIEFIFTADLILYILMLVKSARHSEEAFRRTLLLRIEATRLAASLDREYTTSKATAARFRELANHDPLTGLANRAAFSASVNDWLHHACELGSTFYLFFLDLDHFKSINDTLGHSAGDQVLKEAALRLNAALDGDHVVARLGGDEFAILLSLHSQAALDDDAAGQVAARILSRFSPPFRVGEQSVSIGVSVGIAKFPDDGTTVEDLLANADLALYAAKDGGRHAWRRFDSQLLVDATMARSIEVDLPIALRDKTIQVVFQPQVLLDGYRVVGFEALLRWHHPVLGWISPPAIVAAARKTHTSERLTGFVLDAACRQVRRLMSEGLHGISIAVNVSPSELVHCVLPDLVQRVLSEHGIDPSRLELEITEEAFAASDAALATLSRLSSMGIKLAIDDFGTGYSSIAYLRRMRVDRIKIDRSFVTGMAERPDDLILVRAILEIGRSFGIEVLAEGVETIGDAELLQACGCKAAQGYYFGRPMSPADIGPWLADHSKRYAMPRSLELTDAA